MHPPTTLTGSWDPGIPSFHEKSRSSSQPGTNTSLEFTSNPQFFACSIMFNLRFSPPLGDFVTSPVSVFSIAPTLQLLLLHSQQQNLYGKGEPVDQFPSDWGLGPASAPSFGKLMQGLPRGRHILVAPGSQNLVVNENFSWLPWMLLKLKITSDIQRPKCGGSGPSHLFLAALQHGFPRLQVCHMSIFGISCHFLNRVEDFIRFKLYPTCTY